MKFLAYLLAPFRIVMFVMYVFLGVLIIMAFFRVMNRSARQYFIQMWARVLLWIVNVRVKIDMPPVRLPMRGLLVGNHSSWIDIFVALSVQPVRFIAKSDIKSWPFFGTLASGVDPIYVERGNRHAIRGTNQEISSAAKNGDLIGLYPEGTTTDGSYMLPFKSNLFQPAIDNQMHIYPLAVTYSQHGRYTAVAAYAGDTSLLGSLWQLIMSGGITAHARYGAIIPAAQFDSRQELAEVTQEAVARLIGLSVMKEEVYAQVQAGV